MGSCILDYSNLGYAITFLTQSNTKSIIQI